MGQWSNGNEAVMLSLSPCCLRHGRFYEAAILSAKERRAGMKEEGAMEKMFAKETINSEKNLSQRL